MTGKTMVPNKIESEETFKKMIAEGKKKKEMEVAMVVVNLPVLSTVLHEDTVKEIVDQVRLEQYQEEVKKVKEQILVHNGFLDRSGEIANQKCDLANFERQIVQKKLQVESPGDIYEKSENTVDGKKRVWMIESELDRLVMMANEAKKRLKELGVELG